MPLESLIFAYCAYTPRSCSQHMPFLAIQNNDWGIHKLVVLAVLLEDYRADITQACIECQELCTAIVRHRQQLVEFMTKSWQDLNLHEPLSFGKEESLTLNGFSAKFATGWVEACRKFLGRMLTWKDLLQLPHQTELSIELSRRESSWCTSTCLSLGDVEGGELTKVSKPIADVIRNVIGEDTLSSFERTMWVSSHSQLAHISKSATSGGFSGSGCIWTCWVTGVVPLTHSQLLDQQQKWNYTRSSANIEECLINETDTYASSCFADGLAMDSVPIRGLGGWTSADEDLTCALTGLNVSVIDSHRSLVCRNMMLGLAPSATINTPAIEEEDLYAFEEDPELEEEEMDKYWTWNVETQKFIHVDEDTGETIYHPDEFD